MANPNQANQYDGAMPADQIINEVRNMDTGGSAPSTGEQVAETIVNGLHKKGLVIASHVEIVKLAVEHGYNVSMSGDRLEVTRPESESHSRINDVTRKADEMVAKIHGLYNRMDLADGAINKSHKHMTFSELVRKLYRRQS